jgi:hypothetical protein
LSPIVFGQLQAVNAPVVLDAQSLLLVKEVGTTDEPAPSVVDRHLRLRAGKPGQDEEHAQARLHGRLSGRLHVLQHLAQFLDAPSACIRVGP